MAASLAQGDDLLVFRDDHEGACRKYVEAFFLSRDAFCSHVAQLVRRSLKGQKGSNPHWTLVWPSMMQFVRNEGPPDAVGSIALDSIVLLLENIEGVLDSLEREISVSHAVTDSTSHTDNGSGISPISRERYVGWSSSSTSSSSTAISSVRSQEKIEIVLKLWKLECIALIMRKSIAVPDMAKVNKTFDGWYSNVSKLADRRLKAEAWKCLLNDKVPQSTEASYTVKLLSLNEEQGGFQMLLLSDLFSKLGSSQQQVTLRSNSSFPWELSECGEKVSLLRFILLVSPVELNALILLCRVCYELREYSFAHVALQNSSDLLDKAIVLRQSDKLWSMRRSFIILNAEFLHMTDHVSDALVLLVQLARQDRRIDFGGLDEELGKLLISHIDSLSREAISQLQFRDSIDLLTILVNSSYPQQSGGKDPSSSSSSFLWIYYTWRGRVYSKLSQHPQAARDLLTAMDAESEKLISHLRVLKAQSKGEILDSLYAYFTFLSSNNTEIQTRKLLLRLVLNIDPTQERATMLLMDLSKKISQMQRQQNSVIAPPSPPSVSPPEPAPAPAPSHPSASELSGIVKLSPLRKARSRSRIQAISSTFLSTPSENEGSTAALANAAAAARRQNSVVGINNSSKRKTANVKDAGTSNMASSSSSSSSSSSLEIEQPYNRKDHRPNPDLSAVGSGSDEAQRKPRRSRVENSVEKEPGKKEEEKHESVKQPESEKESEKESESESEEKEKELVQEKNQCFEPRGHNDSLNEDFEDRNNFSVRIEENVVSDDDDAIQKEEKIKEIPKEEEEGDVVAVDKCSPEPEPEPEPEDLKVDSTQQCIPSDEDEDDESGANNVPLTEKSENISGEEVKMNQGLELANKNTKDFLLFGGGGDHQTHPSPAPPPREDSEFSSSSVQSLLTQSIVSTTTTTTASSRVPGPEPGPGSEIPPLPPVTTVTTELSSSSFNHPLASDLSNSPHLLASSLLIASQISNSLLRNSSTQMSDFNHSRGENSETTRNRNRTESGGGGGGGGTISIIDNYDASSQHNNVEKENNNVSSSASASASASPCSAPSIPFLLQKHTQQRGSGISPSPMSLSMDSPLGNSGPDPRSMSTALVLASCVNGPFASTMNENMIKGFLDLVMRTVEKGDESGDASDGNVSIVDEENFSPFVDAMLPLVAPLDVLGILDGCVGWAAHEQLGLLGVERAQSFQRRWTTSQLTSALNDLSSNNRNRHSNSSPIFLLVAPSPMFAPLPHLPKNFVVTLNSLFLQWKSTSHLKEIVKGAGEYLLAAAPTAPADSSSESIIGGGGIEQQVNVNMSTPARRRYKSSLMPHLDEDEADDCWIPIWNRDSISAVLIQVASLGGRGEIVLSALGDARGARALGSSYRVLYRQMDAKKKRRRMRNGKKENNSSSNDDDDLDSVLNDWILSCWCWLGANPWLWAVGWDFEDLGNTLLWPLKQKHSNGDDGDDSTSSFDKNENWISKLVCIVGASDERHEHDSSSSCALDRYVEWILHFTFLMLSSPLHMSHSSSPSSSSSSLSNNDLSRFCLDLGTTILRFCCEHYWLHVAKKLLVEDNLDRISESVRDSIFETVFEIAMTKARSILTPKSSSSSSFVIDPAPMASKSARTPHRDDDDDDGIYESFERATTRIIKHHQTQTEMAVSTVSILSFLCIERNSSLPWSISKKDLVGELVRLTRFLKDEEHYIKAVDMFVDMIPSSADRIPYLKEKLIHHIKAGKAKEASKELIRLKKIDSRIDQFLHEYLKKHPSVSLLSLRHVLVAEAAPLVPLHHWNAFTSRVSLALTNWQNPSQSLGIKDERVVFDALVLLQPSLINECDYSAEYRRCVGKIMVKYENLGKVLFARNNFDDVVRICEFLLQFNKVLAEKDRKRITKLRDEAAKKATGCLIV